MLSIFKSCIFAAKFIEKNNETNTVSYV